MQTVESLRERFRDPRLHFQDDAGGLVSFHARTDCGELKVFLQGAHVSHWQPAGQKPVLWMSQSSVFAPGEPIRGGVPICFPWFGPHPSDTKLPPHGPARRATWRLDHAAIEPDGSVEAELSAEIDGFALTFFVRACHELQMRLRIQNLTGETRTAEAALHTYLAVGDIRETLVTGLSGRRYVDKVRGGQTFEQERGPIGFEGEIDRVYTDTIQAVIVHDPVFNRRLVIDKDNSRSTVVWNPWIEKARRMPDFGDDEWPGMLCIETANVGSNRITLGAGEKTAMEACIRVEAD